MIIVKRHFPIKSNEIFLLQNQDPSNMKSLRNIKELPPKITQSSSNKNYKKKNVCHPYKKYCLHINK